MSKVKSFVKSNNRSKKRLVNGIYIETDCNICGACFHDENGNFLGSCRVNNHNYFDKKESQGGIENVCLESEYTRANCMLNSIRPMSPQEIEKEINSGKSTVKKQRQKSDKTDKENNNLSFEIFVNMFKIDCAKTSIINAMVNSGLSETASNSLYSKMSCCCGACLRPNSKESTVYQTVRHCLHNGPLPIGDASSIKFVTRFCNAWGKKEEVKEEEVIIC